ncbi:MAG: hypothetical protein U0793_19525 [Gemmataceae bacterium]
MNRGRFVVVAVLLSGCAPAPEAMKASAVVELGAAFEPSGTGTIEGTVTWTGDLPRVEPLILNIPGSPTRTERNPNEPCIDPKTRLVTGALVFLDSVDPARSHPWDLASVRVVQADGELMVYQGENPTSIGVVRQGAEVTWESREDDVISLRARGASFFTIPFLKPGAVHRPLLKEGHVELGSGCGLYWLRGHLFVSAHPYVCLTDKNGRFTLDRVPAGVYRVHCWLPNWEIERLERDPESRETARLQFKAGFESVRPVNVTAKDASTAPLTIGR